jgi:adenylate cyclase, class 2
VVLAGVVLVAMSISDYSEGRFGSVDAIYKSEAGRDILAEPTLLFADSAKQEDASSAVRGH